MLHFHRMANPIRFMITISDCHHKQPMIKIKGNTDTQSSRFRHRLTHYDRPFAGLQTPDPWLGLAAFRGRRTLK